MAFFFHTALFRSFAGTSTILLLPVPLERLTPLGIESFSRAAGLVFLLPVTPARVVVAKNVHCNMAQSASRLVIAAG